MAEFAGIFVYLSMPRNASGFGPLPRAATGIEAARRGEHEPVERAEAGHHDQHEQSHTGRAAEDLLEGELGAGLAAGHDLGVRDTAGQTDIVEDIRQRDDERADDECDRQVALGVFELGVDACGDDPALIGKGRGCQCGEQRVTAAAVDCRDDGGEVFDRRAVDETDDRADHAHEQQRDELDDRGGHLKLARQDRRQGVDGIAADEKQARDDHDRSARDVKPAQHAQIPCADPCQHGGHRREVDKRRKPAHVIGVALAHERLGIVHQTIDVRVARGKDGEHIRADDHDQAADGPCKDAERQIAAGRGENLFRFEEHTAADDDADNERDRRRQAILFLQFVVHKIRFFFPQN